MEEAELTIAFGGTKGHFDKKGVPHKVLEVHRDLADKIKLVRANKRSLAYGGPHVANAA